MIRENTTLMREIIEKMDYMARVMDAEHKVIYMNEKMRTLFSHTLGHICYNLLGKSEKCDHCVTSGSKETGKTDTKDVLIGDRYYEVMSSPVSINGGENYSIELLHDITDQKKIQDELLKQYEKLKLDLEFAKQIQYSTLPIDGDYWDSIKINAIYQPSEDLGGDLFDIVKIDKEKTLLYIADVSGHGVKSSLLTIFLRQLIRGRTYESTVDLKEILDTLIKSYNDLKINEEQYLSVLFCCYDKTKKELVLLNAGHNCLPMIVTKNGHMKEVIVRGMPICNLIQNPNHEEVVIKVESGDRILLFTDGITEAYNDRGIPFGSEGITRIVKENLQLDGKALAKKIVEGVNDYTGTLPIDDVAVIVAEIL
ncbi:PP2C family protein-serine/threonine phosphatase [Sinanaerobacter chloroacetimidivorans]|jgi:sigma-B regulation protein RsbU (phosphoserine phosphatase)|uniref:Serine/threonine-protein phosphatase n=1 Tax=Sinanaerobacter chloroacetimidivorans TaxID=2818044 RepID=A0A8J8B0K3_9FIRM|nr:PP2C family protein-serine/threonine phosphatase [Sinanaerobacter chloroacetimidivorans]MBR0597698.1 serine/threonine-protein phosphatase [Sinanaerobacter chloroacetimidivorans]